MRIMNFRKFLSGFNESLKELKLNNILDKISKKLPLNNDEVSFLDNYENEKEETLMDYKLISKDSAFRIISNLLSSNKLVICNIFDRNGSMDSPIISITNDLSSNKCEIILKSKEKAYLYDRYLYNICYTNGHYSLEIEDEYFEKVPIEK